MKRFATRAWLVLLVVLVAQLTGCGHVPTLDPPELHLGQDTCYDCSMIISEARFAAAVVTIQDGQRVQYLFDDLGEMLRFTLPQAAQSVPTSQIRYWAHDFETSSWIDASKAHYVWAKSIHTPMGTGIIAFAEQASAQASAKSNEGQAMNFEQIRQQAALKNKAMSPEDHGEH